MSDELDWSDDVTIENEWPSGVVIRELVSEDRQPSAREFIHCNDIPMLKRAFNLPGSAGLVWLLASHRSRVKKTAWVTLPQSMLSEWGIGRSAKSRALAALREAGYIDVVHPEGGSSRIRVRKTRVQDLNPVGKFVSLARSSCGVGWHSCRSRFGNGTEPR